MHTVEYLESEIRRRHKQRREALWFRRSIHRWTNFDEVCYFSEVITNLNAELRKAKKEAKRCPHTISTAHALPTDGTESSPSTGLRQ